MGPATTTTTRTKRKSISYRMLLKTKTISIFFSFSLSLCFESNHAPHSLFLPPRECYYYLFILYIVCVCCAVLRCSRITEMPYFMMVLQTQNGSNTLYIDSGIRIRIRKDDRHSPILGGAYTLYNAKTSQTKEDGQKEKNCNTKIRNCSARTTKKMMMMKWSVVGAENATRKRRRKPNKFNLFCLL